MRVQRVISPRGGAVSWTVIGGDHRPVVAIDSYLAWLSHIERSPNTVRAYASDLKAYWTFLESRASRWDEPSLELLGEFTAWLRQPADNVVVLPMGRPHRSAKTVNRMLSAVAGFYEYHARNGVEFARALSDERRAGRGNYKPFLHGIARAKARGRVGRLREQRRLPATLSVEQMRAVIGAQDRLRDRFLFGLLALTGMLVGQALGLRHCDFVTQERRIEIVAREDNANGARGKGGEGSVPVTGGLVRCYSDYMHEEYGALDSDYQQRGNIQGQTIVLDPDGPHSDAAWALENLARAKQTLPNGYCGLPLRQRCPHPNACLTCDNFLTTSEFLPAASRSARAHRAAPRRGPGERQRAAGRDERAGPAQPAADHRGPRDPR